MMSAKYSLLRLTSSPHPTSTKWHPFFPRKVLIALLGTACVIFAAGHFFRHQLPNNPHPFRFFAKPCHKPQSICKPYTPLYTDAISTSEYFRLRGGISYSDYLTSRSDAEFHGSYIQVKLYDMNLYVGNGSNCYESRMRSLILNLNSAVDSARWEGEELPDFEVFLDCKDAPPTSAPAIWHMVK